MSSYPQFTIILTSGLEPTPSIMFSGPRAQTNTATAFIDGNFLYGSNMRLSDELRLLKGGLMKTLPAFSDLDLKDLMPLKLQFPDDGCIRSSPDVFCFLSGNIPPAKFRSLTAVQKIKGASLPRFEKIATSQFKRFSFKL